MKIIAEKDRSFIDKGKIKLYNSFKGSAVAGSLNSLQKVIIQPDGREKMELKNDLQTVLIVLSGTLEIKCTHFKDLKLCDAALIIEKDSKPLILRNRQEHEAELLILNISRLKQENNLKKTQLNYQIPLVSNDIERSCKSKENTVLISKIFCQRNGTLDYRQLDYEKILILYIISGEADINGNTLFYNDTAIFETLGDQIILADFKKNTELLIIEIPS